MTDLSPVEGGVAAVLMVRLEAATVGDRELDGAIWQMFTPGATRRHSVVKSSKGLWADYTIDETREASGRLIVVPSYTSSVDAAFALAAQTLPVGLTWRVESDSSFTAAFWDDPDYEPVGAGRASTPALALCIAILRTAAQASATSPSGGV